MISRTLQAVLRQRASSYKAVLLTGPRQSGKTTLARATFPEKPYLSFENPDTRAIATADPRSFLARFGDGAIFDEVQRVPELFSYLQQILDESPATGRFILTGSQHLALSQNASQSLAGRVAILQLLPFSRKEMLSGGIASTSLAETLFNGSYPPVFDQKLPSGEWFDNYIATYLERDVRQIINVRDLAAFQRFLGLCAGNTGQLFNASRLSADCGVASVTVSQWLSVLESSYLIFRLQPYHGNFRKRLVKTPKLYFWDTGLAVRLLGIQTPEQLHTHPLRGSLFENWVIADAMKTISHSGQRPQFYFWRDSAGLEVDLLQDIGGGALEATEIKSGATFTPDWTTGLLKWSELARTAAPQSPEPSPEKAPALHLVYGGAETFDFKNIRIRSWNTSL
ncbi:MAG: ATP-binding protein [Puniceicoccales bacterium]|jgi:predicted AAA+ superfamily ATPase|nr:ATP-binding protein [Puniceicoccales bacterium]